MNTACLPLTALALMLGGLRVLAAVEPAKPNAVEFAPQPAKFVRFVIHESSGGQPRKPRLPRAWPAMRFIKSPT